MPIKPMIRRLSTLLMMLAFLLPQGALAQEEAFGIEFIVQESGDSFIALPLLVGHPDAEAEAAINAAIYSDGGFADYERILSGLDTLGTGLQVKAQAQIIKGKDGKGLLSILVSASGRIGPGRPGYRSRPLMYELPGGTALAVEDIFINAQAAQDALDQLVEDIVEPLISDYLYPEELYPVPLESFLIDESGIAFFYTQEAYTTLSGQSGAVHFLWHELKGLLKQGEDDLLSSLELSNQSEDPVDMIASAVSQGKLPGLPVQLGQSAEELLLDYPLLTDPEVLLSGDTYQPEDARFRSTLVIVKDDLITGLLSSRAELWGIITGESTQSQVLDILGQPELSLTLDETAAEGYGLEEGSLDSYSWDGNQLRLNYDRNMTLKTVWISRTN